MAKLYNIAAEDKTIAENSLDLNDQSGKKTKLALWLRRAMTLLAILLALKE